MTIRLPDETLLQRFTASLKSADDKSRDIMLVHYINLAVVAVFVILAIGSGYLSYYLRQGRLVYDTRGILQRVHHLYTTP